VVRHPAPTGRTDPPGPRFERIPKPTGGTRWLTRLDPVGDARYREAVRPVAGRIERSLGPEVFAVRSTPSRTGWEVRPWGPARAAWRRVLGAAFRQAARGTTFAVADVRDCYASISPKTIGALLGPDAADAVAILRLLHHHGARGLPVGPDASAILANAALARLDQAIRRAGTSHVRWVDDFVVWGAATDVRRSLAALAAAAAGIGLELHGVKTRLLSDRHEARALLLGERESSIIAAP